MCRLLCLLVHYFVSERKKNNVKIFARKSERDERERERERERQRDRDFKVVPWPELLGTCYSNEFFS